MKKEVLRRRLRVMGLIAAGGLLLAGCATQEQPYGGGSGQALSPEERRLQHVENEVATLNRRVDAQQSSGDQGHLESDIRDLRGQIQVLQHQQQEDERSNAQAIHMLSQQIQALSGAPASGSSSAASAAAGALGNLGSTVPNGAIGATAGAGLPPSVGNLPSAGSSTDAASGSGAAGSGAGGAEQTLYLANFGDLKGGHFNKAIAGFRSQLAKYPQGNYADNAWYWLGESYYVQQQYPKAMESFKTLISQFPASPKVPDALLEIGRVYKATNKTSSARSTWQRLQRDYPQSDAAQSAKKLLSELH